MDIRIKRVDVWSLSRILGIVQAGVGLVTGIFFTLSYIIDPEFLRASFGGIGMFFGVWSFIVLPVLNAALGFLSGALVAWGYNFYVRTFGSGISLEIETDAGLTGRFLM